MKKLQANYSNISNKSSKDNIISLPISEQDLEETASQVDKQHDLMTTWAIKMDGMESDLVKDFDENLSGLGLELGANAYNMSEVLNLPIFKQENLLGGSQGLPPLQYMLCAPTSPATKVYEETLTYLNQGQSYELRLKKLRDIADLLPPMKLVKSQLRVVFHDRRLQYTELQQFETWKINRPGDRLLNIDIPMSVGVIQPKEHPEQVNMVEFVWDVEKEASVWVQVHCISTEFAARRHGGEKGVPFRIQIDTYTLEGGSADCGQYIHSASCQIKVFKPKGADRKQKTDKDKMDRRSAQEKLKYQPSYDSTLLNECMPPNLGGGEQVDGGTPQQQQQSTPSSNAAQQRLQAGAHFSELNAQPTYAIMAHPGGTPTPDRGGARNRNSVGSFADAVQSQQQQQQQQQQQVCVNIAPAPPPAPSPSQLHAQHVEAPRAAQSPLLPSFGVAQTQDWLNRNRFTAFAKIFANFSGSELLTLSRDDLVQICDRADGIRLFNALRNKTVHPRLTVFLTPAQIDSDDHDLAVYKAFYLPRATVGNLLGAVASCVFEPTSDQSHPIITRMLYQPARSTIHVLVTDEVVAVMKDESSFTVSLLKNESNNSFQAILKS